MTVKHSLDEYQLQALLSRVQLNDEPLPISAVACEKNEEYLLRMTVTEGKYHLVKRMIAAAGNRVVALKRVSVGGLALPETLALGDWIWLEAAHLEQLAQR